MWQFMKINSNDVLVNSTNIGLKKIKKEDFALLCESKLIEYMIEKDCEYIQIGGLLDEKTYGFGLPSSKKFIRQKIILFIFKIYFFKNLHGMR
jgi:glutamate receptor, ionotropic, invertebrate